MESLLRQLVLALSARLPVELIGPRGVRDWTPESVRVLAEFPFSAGIFLPAAAWSVWTKADPARYQLCIGGSGLMAPILGAASRRHLSTAVYLHGLDITFPHPVYQRFFVSGLARIDRVLVNSRYTGALAAKAGISEARIRVVNPGVGMPAASDVHSAQREGGPLLLSVGRLVARKGLAEFIERAMPSLLRRYPDLRLCVVGSEPPGNRARVLDRMRATIEEHGLQQSVHLLGKVDDEQLSALYAQADLHVLPLVNRPGDVEGFGMVVLEAAARGVPTVAFDLGGVGDALRGPDAGQLIAQDDYRAFIDAVCHWLGHARPDLRHRLVDQTRERSWERFGDEVVAALGVKL